MTRVFTRNLQVFGTVSLFLAVIHLLAASAALAQATGATVQAVPGPEMSIDAAHRTVTTSSFSITWNTGVDTEAITTLDWMGGSNLTNSNDLNTCGDSNNDVEYFGNSEAPPDPQSGGLVLVGGGRSRRREPFRGSDRS